MRRAVHEVGEGDQRGREPDGGAVKGRDEDLRVCVEGLRHVQVVRDEVAQPVQVRVRLVFRHFSRHGHVRAAVAIVSITHR